MWAESQVWTWSSAILVCQKISQRTWVILGNFQKRFANWFCLCMGFLGQTALGSATFSKGSSSPPDMPKHFKFSQEPLIFRSYYYMTLTDSNCEMKPQDGPFSVRMSGIDKTASDDVRRAGKLQDTVKKQLNFKICKVQMQYVAT